MIKRTMKIQSVRAKEGHGDNDEWFEGTPWVRKESLVSFRQKAGQDSRVEIRKTWILAQHKKKTFYI